jgi:hypothetical protein
MIRLFLLLAQAATPDEGTVVSSACGAPLKKSRDCARVSGAWSPRFYEIWSI